MQFDTVKVEVDGELGRLTLSRPADHNALNATLLHELAEAARWLDHRAGVRVVIVRGEGRFFCPGADLKNLPVADALPSSGKPWLERREVGQLGKRMADAVERMRAITIAQVHGAAVGGGLVLMLACDLRVVAADTILSIPEVELGIPLAWGGVPRLVREVGPARAKELIITARRFTPEEARDMGVVNRVCPPQELARETEALAQNLLAKPSVPLAITKDHVHAVTEAMAPAQTAFADGDVLLGQVLDPEATRAAEGHRSKG